jgi:hypothetical protein
MQSGKNHVITLKKGCFYSKKNHTKVALAVKFAKDFNVVLFV